MSEYKLSDSAKLDLISIARYGDKNFGIQKSDAFRNKLKQQFSHISKQPYLYQAVEHIHPDYRRCVHGVYSIYYKVNDDTIEIMRILRQQDISSNF